jgi:alpha-galactosidase
MNLKKTWAKTNLSGAVTHLPFSFKIGDRSSTAWLTGCKKTVQPKKLEANRTQKTTIWTDPKTGLQLRWVVVEYSDFPTVEWTLYFKNAGSNDSEIIADVKALDTTLQKDTDGEFILHRTVGDGVGDIYRPDPITMSLGTSKTIAPYGGRPSSNEFPYFNIESPQGWMIFAIGWPGQWSAQFKRDEKEGLRVTAGQELTHFKVLAGEELRTPLIVAQFWKGDRTHSQNVWRRWMLAHNTPRINGNLPKTQYNMCNANSYGYFGFTEANQREWMQRYDEEKLTPEYLWIDLCWFKMNPSTTVYNGLYDTEPVRFPNGLKPLSDDLHKQGVKLIAWFEPEHLYPGPENWHVANHPEWLLKVKPGRENEINQGMPLLNRMVYNLGNPEALNWLINNTDKVIKREGIDYYRHDFNIEPLTFWRENDAPDRQGVTEIKYVTGFLTYFDELLKRNPTMWIDNCASGGRRNDVETLRRSLPLLRSDTWGEPTGQQCQTYGLANWIPFWGTGIVYSENKDLTYIFRSHMGPSFTACWDLRVKMNYDQHRKIIAQWKSVRDLIMVGDYYPLTPYSPILTEWMAWQYNCPEKGEGIIQAFRRPAAKASTMHFKIQGLDAKARYSVKDMDTEQTQTMTGKDLMSLGLKVEIKDQPGSALIAYRKL